MLTTVLRIDTFLVNTYLGPGSLGIYSVAVAVGEFLLMVPSAVGVALFPYLTSADEKTQMDTIGMVARMTVILSSAGCLGLALVGYPAILVLFGRRFAGAYIPLLALLPGLIAMSIVYAFANFFSSRGEPIVNFFVFGVATLVNILANVVLLPRFHVVGASIASSVAYGIIAIMFVVLVRARTGMSVRELIIPRTEDLKVIGAWLGRVTGRTATS
jgi:O-antigen/teichoic acid export membrane protein